MWEREGREEGEREREEGDGEGESDGRTDREGRLYVCIYFMVCEILL